jgi:solute carrier family 25 iron transporter 28/37
MQAGGSNLGYFRTARILLKEEGLLRFWKGANVVVSGCIPAHASQFCAYEFLKQKLEMRNEEYDLFGNLAIGATITFAHDFFIAPSDVIKQRLQLCKQLNARSAIRNIMRDDGLKGLYRSYPITVFMNIPFQSIVVSTNENLKTWIKPWERNNPHFWYFVCAGIAGGTAGMLTNPIDVVKTRL